MKLILSERANQLLVAGVDEVGRGPLAGPVVTAAVILDPENPIDGLMDSKKLSESRREELAVLIKELAVQKWKKLMRLISSRQLCWLCSERLPDYHLHQNMR